MCSCLDFDDPIAMEIVEAGFLIAAKLEKEAKGKINPELAKKQLANLRRRQTEAWNKYRQR